MLLYKQVCFSFSGVYDVSYVSYERLTALMMDSTAASGPRILSRLWKASAAPPTASEGNNCSAAEKQQPKITSSQLHTRLLTKSSDTLKILIMDSKFYLSQST